MSRKKLINGLMALLVAASFIMTSCGKSCKSGQCTKKTEVKKSNGADKAKKVNGKSAVKSGKGLRKGTRKDK